MSRNNEVLRLNLEGLKSNINGAIDAALEILNLDDSCAVEEVKEKKAGSTRKSKAAASPKKKAAKKKAAPPKDELNFDEDDDEDLDELEETEDVKTGISVETGISVADMRSGFIDFVKKFKTVATGKQNAKKVLTKFGVKKIEDLDADDYQEVLDILETKK